MFKTYVNDINKMICYKRKQKKITTLALLSKSYRHYYRESRLHAFSVQRGEQSEPISLSNGEEAAQAAGGAKKPMAE